MKKAVIRHARFRRARELVGERGAGRGRRLGIGHFQKLVTPPRTAAREPEARSSLYSLPGSRKWTCGSMTRQEQMSLGVEGSSARSSIAAASRTMRPFSHRTSPSKVDPSGRAMRALRIRVGTRAPLGFCQLRRGPAGTGLSLSAFRVSRPASCSRCTIRRSAAPRGASLPISTPQTSQ